MGQLWESESDRSGRGGCLMSSYWRYGGHWCVIELDLLVSSVSEAGELRSKVEGEYGLDLL